MLVLWSQGISREAQEVEVEGLEEGAAKDQQQRDADGHRGAMDIHTGGLDSFHPGAVAVDIHFAGLDKVAQTSFLCDIVFYAKFANLVCIAMASSGDMATNQRHEGGDQEGIESIERFYLDLELSIVTRLPQNVIQYATACRCGQVKLECNHEHDHHERIHQRPFSEGIEEVQQALALADAEIFGRREPADHHKHWLQVWPNATETNDKKPERIDLSVEHILDTSDE
mmetsp:Transcript_50181/g.80145  ORF Transcript_50181/g.80145 Transcript_50181/m.80145 type:complete len:227 (-) Transcript_50181:42-722(-)